MKRRKGKEKKRTKQHMNSSAPAKPKEKGTKLSEKTSTRELRLRERNTHISTESFKCQLCLLSILMEFVLSVVFALLELLELPARCIKLMLYHFLDFSNELSCGFVLDTDTDGFFGLFSFSACACGWHTEPSHFVAEPSHFSIKFLASHSSFRAGVALSVSSEPSEPAELLLGITSNCVTSSPMFFLFRSSPG